ncbi:MAG: glucosylceramidase [Pseudonocardiales bacterium]|nr:glucosylceramidase [Pseudonocardiales bacterium]
MRIHHRLTVFAVLIPALTCAALTTARAAPGKRARTLTPGLQSAALGTATAGPAVSWVVTTGDRRQLLSAQTPTTFGPDLSSYYSWSRIDINDAVRYQTVQGVGAAMTESSAVLLGGLPAPQKTQVLNRLFNRATGAGLSVIRTPLGASDFARSDYTFDDMPWGQTDPSLAKFSISRDEAQLLPLVAAARGINAGLTVLATPWTAPAWMKTNVNTHNGQLAPAFEDAYARYLVKAITADRAAGAPVSTVAVTNEPESPRGYSPSMTMTATQQAEFVGAHLRPALNAAGLSGVGILGYEGNWDDSAYPISEVTGPYAASFAGTAVHCYAGDETAQAAIAAAAPSKQVWMSECSGGTWSADFAQNLRWNAHHLLIGAFRNASRAVMFFNLALDPTGGPTNGGCTNCRGVLTIDPVTHAVTYNVEYYLLAHIGRFVAPGAVRIQSTYSNPTGVQSVAFRNPDGTHALVLYNEGGSAQPVTVRWQGQAARVQLPSGAIATLHW